MSRNYLSNSPAFANTEHGPGRLSAWRAGMRSFDHLIKFRFGVANFLRHPPVSITQKATQDLFCKSRLDKIVINIIGGRAMVRSLSTTHRDST